MAKDPEFVILKPTAGWLAESEMQRILGAVVKNPLAPTDASYPKNPVQYWEKPMVKSEYDDFILSKEQISSASSEAEVRDLGKMRWAKSAGQNIDLTSKKIFVRKLRRLPAMWKKMKEDEEVQENVPDWVHEKSRVRRKKKNQVCLVVGVLICQDVFVATSDEEEKDFLARNEAPLGTVTEIVAATHGVPPTTGGTGNIRVEGSQTSVQRKYFQAKGQGKRIFALELKIVSFKGTELSLTDKTIDIDRKLGLDREDEDGEEDMVIRDVSDGEWAGILDDESEYGGDDDGSKDDARTPKY